MPARGMRRAVFDIPAAALIAWAEDPQSYKRMLEEFAARKQAAEEAEAKAKAAGASAAAAVEAATAAQREEAARVAVRLAQHAEEAEAKVAELSRWQDQLQSLERALGVREAKAAAKQDQANMNMTLLSDRSRAMDEREAEVTRRETALAKT